MNQMYFGVLSGVADFKSKPFQDPYGIMGNEISWRHWRRLHWQQICRFSDKLFDRKFFVSHHNAPLLNGSCPKLFCSILDGFFIQSITTRVFH